MSSIGIEESRKRLLDGVKQFQCRVFPERQAEYERLVREGQTPHALFITCADSRIDPELLTQSGPGELFVSRNIGNLVPAYGEMLGGISAVIEYAVTALEVDQIVVCGHSDCGAMRGLLQPEKVSIMPTVKSWLRNAEAALSIVQARYRSPAELDGLNELIAENVLLQMNHLRTHPSVAGKLARGQLALSGWVYDIARGAVRVYDEEQRTFILPRADPATKEKGMQPQAQPNINPLLWKAIDEARLIRLFYQNRERILEPHDYGIQKGVAKLLGYQIGGSSSHKLPDWRWMEEDQISDIQLLDRTFPGGRPIPTGKHHEWDKLFIRVKPSVSKQKKQKE